MSLGEFGLLFVLPLFLQAVLGLSAFDTGLIFLSLAIGAFFAAPLAATLAKRYGPRRTVSLGMALEAIGIFLTTILLSSTVEGMALVIPLFIYGIGVGLATAQLTSVTLSDIPVEKSGIASGANSTMRQVGSALGIAILGTILFVSLGNGVRDKLATVPGPAAGRSGGHRHRDGILGRPGAHGHPRAAGHGADRAAHRPGVRGRGAPDGLRRGGVRAPGAGLQRAAAGHATRR